MRAPWSIERQSTQPSDRGSLEGEMRAPVRVLVADDNHEVLMATVDLILDEGEAEVVFTATDVVGAVRGAAAHLPDLAFIDAWLHGGGAELASVKIRSVSPGTRVVALASANDLDLMLGLRAAGVSACYEKETLGAVLPSLLASVRP